MSLVKPINVVPTVVASLSVASSLELHESESSDSTDAALVP